MPSLTALVKSLEGDKVILSFEDGQTLRVPLAACEGSPKEGMETRVLIVSLGAEDAGRQALARDLLNEILSG